MLEKHIQDFKFVVCFVVRSSKKKKAPQYLSLAHWPLRGLSRFDFRQKLKYHPLSLCSVRFPTINLRILFAFACVLFVGQVHTVK